MRPLRSKVMACIEEPTVVAQILCHLDRTHGEMEIDMGILDPIKVRRLALQNAASVSGLLLTTEVMNAEAPKDDEHSHGGPPGGGMGGMDM